MEEEIKMALEDRIEEAKEKVLSENGMSRLREILLGYISVFGIKLGSQPAAKIKRFGVKINPSAKPFRSAHRRYGSVQNEFIEAKIQNIEKIGAVYRNPTSRWASPSLAVPKPGTTQIRFTVDL